jgi:hypothetical protein
MPIFNVMLKPPGAQSYVAAGRIELADAPADGAAIALDYEGRAIRGTVDRLFIPPGCDEHCIGTIFASA